MVEPFLECTSKEVKPQRLKHPKENKKILITLQWYLWISNGERGI